MRLSSLDVAHSTKVRESPVNGNHPAKTPNGNQTPEVLKQVMKDSTSSQKISRNAKAKARRSKRIASTDTPEQPIKLNGIVEATEPMDCEPDTAQPSTATSGRKSRRKRKNSEVEAPSPSSPDAEVYTQPSFGELQNPSTSAGVPTTESSAPLQVSDVVSLLQQGLRSKDVEILDRVFRQTPRSIVTETLRKFPVASLDSLVQELVERIQRNARTNHLCIEWLQSVNRTHASFLCSSESIQSLIDPFIGFMDQQFTLYPKIAQVHGRLNLLIGLANREADTTVSATAEVNPALEKAPFFYVDDSDEEEQLGTFVFLYQW